MKTLMFRMRVENETDPENGAELEFPLSCWFLYPVKCVKAVRQLRKVAQMSEEEIHEWVTCEMEAGRAQNVEYTNRNTGEVTRY